MVLEKLSGFAEGKYDVSLPFHDIASDFEAKRPDALRQIEDMAITKRIVSTCRDSSLSSAIKPAWFDSPILEHDWCSPTDRSAVAVALEGPILHLLQRAL